MLNCETPVYTRYNWPTTTAVWAVKKSTLIKSTLNSPSLAAHFVLKCKLQFCLSNQWHKTPQGPSNTHVSLHSPFPGMSHCCTARVGLTRGLRIGMLKSGEGVWATQLSDSIQALALAITFDTAKSKRPPPPRREQKGAIVRSWVPLSSPRH